MDDHMYLHVVVFFIVVGSSNLSNKCVRGYNKNGKWDIDFYCSRKEKGRKIRGISVVL